MHWPLSGASRAASCRQPANGCSWPSILPESSLLYGDVAVHPLDDQPATYEVGITFAPAFQGRGLATEALARVLEFLFHDQNAHRVVAFCDTRNAAVARLLRRLTFRQESHQIEADFLKDEWTTVDGYAVLARDWNTV